MLCSPLNENINTSTLKDYFLKIPTGRWGIHFACKGTKYRKENSWKKNPKNVFASCEKGIFLSLMISRKARRGQNKTARIYVIKATTVRAKLREPICLFLEPQEPALFQGVDTTDNKDLSTWQRSPPRSQTHPSATFADQTISEYKQECLGWGQWDFITSGHLRAFGQLYFVHRKSKCILWGFFRGKSKREISVGDIQRSDMHHHLCRLEAAL